MNQYLQANQADFNKAIEFFKKEISHLRTGRANPNLLEGIFVEVYGAKTPLNGLANINVSDGHSIAVSPWDKKVIKDIERAIVEADLGVGVINEGDKVRITIPVMTEENRRELVKKLNEKMEECRISFRQVRDEIKTAIEKAEKDKVIAEDDRFRFIKELDETAAKKNDELKELRDKKEKEVMTI
jgi:ribosome recycling factor